LRLGTRDELRYLLVLDAIVAWDSGWRLGAGGWGLTLELRATAHIPTVPSPRSGSVARLLAQGTGGQELALRARCRAMRR